MFKVMHGKLHRSHPLEMVGKSPRSGSVNRTALYICRYLSRYLYRYLSRVICGFCGHSGRPSSAPKGVNRSPCYAHTSRSLSSGRLHEAQIGRVRRLCLAVQGWSGPAYLGASKAPKTGEPCNGLPSIPHHSTRSVFRPGLCWQTSRQPASGPRCALCHAHCGATPCGKTVLCPHPP